MGSMTTAQVDKKPYRNNTAGWLGVVKLDHLGGQVGTPVEPHGTVWLSDDEATLTARAPSNPKDNPFVEQLFQFQNEQGEIVEAPMCPLVLIEDDREVPAENDRFVPGAPVDSMTQAAIQDTHTALAAESHRSVPTDPQRTDPVPAVKGLVQAESGALAGSNVPAPKAPEGDPVATDVPTQTPPQKPAPQGVSSVAVEEEHAAELASGEETGAAETPAGDAPQGEYAAQEEVGSPDAPTKADA